MTDPNTIAALMVLLSAILHATVAVFAKSATDHVTRRAIIDATSGVVILPVLFFFPHQVRGFGLSYP